LVFITKIFYMLLIPRLSRRWTKLLCHPDDRGATSCIYNRHLISRNVTSSVLLYLFLSNFSTFNHRRLDISLTIHFKHIQSRSLQSQFKQVGLGGTEEYKQVDSLGKINFSAKFRFNFFIYSEMVYGL